MTLNAIGYNERHPTKDACSIEIDIYRSLRSDKVSMITLTSVNHLNLKTLQAQTSDIESFKVVYKKMLNRVKGKYSNGIISTVINDIDKNHSINVDNTPNTPMFLLSKYLKK